MTKLNWADTERYYEAGVNQGVYYPLDGPGEAWNGLVSVSESPSDSESRPRYLDGRRIGARQTAGSFAGTIEAFTYPDAFFTDVLSQRVRKKFGLSYRVQTSEGDKLHLVYNATVSPSQQKYRYFESDPFSWAFTTTPEVVPDGRPSAHVVIDNLVTYPDALAEMEYILYGSDEAEGRLPLPAELFDIFERHSVLRVTDNGDGTWTATGPDEAIQVNPDGSFVIDWPSAVYISADTYTLRSL